MRGAISHANDAVSRQLYLPAIHRIAITILVHSLCYDIRCDAVLEVRSVACGHDGLGFVTDISAVAVGCLFVLPFDLVVVKGWLVPAVGITTG